MESVREIIAALGGPTKFGRVCGFVNNPAARGSDMLQRDSIPIIYWPRIVAEAERLGLPIDNDTLVKAHAKRPPSDPLPAEPEPAPKSPAPAVVEAA